MHATDALAADDQLSRGISRSFATSGFPANGKYLIRPIVRRVQSGKILINFPKRIEEKEREREREREREGHCAQTFHKIRPVADCSWFVAKFRKSNSPDVVANEKYNRGEVHRRS